MYWNRAMGVSTLAKKELRAKYLPEGEVERPVREGADQRGRGQLEYVEVNKA